MKKTFVKIAAAVSTALLCALPMASSLAANAAYYGDANNDGQVNMADAVIIAQWDTTKHDLHLNRTKADVNKDGRINWFDQKLIQRALLHGNSGAYNLDTVKGTFGDANGDGRITSRDASIMEDILWDGSASINYNGSTINATQTYINNTLALRQRFDVNGDGTFDWTDATVMYCYDYYDYFFDRNYTPVYRRGDSNKDGQVNMADAVNVLQWLANKPNQISQENSDVNLDGIITEADATEIQRICLGLV